MSCTMNSPRIYNIQHVNSTYNMSNTTLFVSNTLYANLPFSLKMSFISHRLSTGRMNNLKPVSKKRVDIVLIGSLSGSTTLAWSCITLNAFFSTLINNKTRIITLLLLCLMHKFKRCLTLLILPLIAKQDADCFGHDMHCIILFN